MPHSSSAVWLISEVRNVYVTVDTVLNIWNSVWGSQQNNMGLIPVRIIPHQGMLLSSEHTHVKHTRQS